MDVHISRLVFISLVMTALCFNTVPLFLSLQLNFVVLIMTSKIFFLIGDLNPQYFCQLAQSGCDDMVKLDLSLKSGSLLYCVWYNRIESGRASLIHKYNHDNKEHKKTCEHFACPV